MEIASTSRWLKATRADPERAGYLRQVMEDNGLSDDFLFSRNTDLIESHEGSDVAAGLRLAYQVKGHIKPPAQVAQLFVALSVSGEDELRRIVESHRALAGYSVADAEHDAVAALRLVLREQPERAGEIRSALFGEVAVAVECQEPASASYGPQDALADAGTESEPSGAESPPGGILDNLERNGGSHG